MLHFFMNIFIPPHYQTQQFINLGLLLLLGYGSGYIYLSFLGVIGLLVWAFVLEKGVAYVKYGVVAYGAFSAWSTTMGVVFMMVATHYWMYLVLLALALLQKHLLVYEKRHFFNPSNFALIMGLLLFYHDVHIVLGQLGDALWLQGVLLLLGVSILYRVKRWIIPLGFSVGYLLFEYLFIVSYDPVMLFEDIYARFYSVSFVLFVLFMLTDPKTTPSTLWKQLVFSLLLAAIATLLDRYSGFRIQHLFMALFFLSPWVPYLCMPSSRTKLFLGVTLGVVLLALSAIIYIEIQPPYFFEMDH